MTIGKIIKDARESASLTQTKLAQKAGVALSTLSCIEAGKRNPTKELARKIAKALDIPEQNLTKFCNREKRAIGEGVNFYIPVAHQPIVKKILRVRPENLHQVNLAIDQILEKQNESQA
jgi:transcriptional regulator with XRE-family HTH domain